MSKPSQSGLSDFLSKTSNMLLSLWCSYFWSYPSIITAKENLNIFTSASCLLLSASVSKPEVSNSSPGGPLSCVSEMFPCFKWMCRQQTCADLADGDSVTWIRCAEAGNYLIQGCPELVLKGRCPAGFGCFPPSTHLDTSDCVINRHVLTWMTRWWWPLMRINCIKAGKHAKTCKAPALEDRPWPPLI